MVDYMKFRDTQEIIDSRLLTSLVQKHNVEYVTKPLERRQLWLALTKEYNGQRGTTVNHARLSKRYISSFKIPSIHVFFASLDFLLDISFSFSELRVEIRLKFIMTDQT